MRHPDVTGLIVAGGQSRRFGTDKARHPVAGRPMIERVHDVLAPLVETVLVSVRTLDTDYDLPAQRVADEYSGAGPLAGLHAGLGRCRTPWLLALACDVPFLTPETLQTLLATRDDPKRPVVARTPDGRRHPLCALYPRTLCPLAEELLEADQFAMHDLLRAAGTVREVAVPHEPLRNVNVRGDLSGVEGTERSRRSG